MKQNRLALAAALTLTFPLAAQGQDSYGYPQIYNVPFWDGCESHLRLEIDYLLWFASQDGNSPCSTFDLSNISLANSDTRTLNHSDNMYHSRWSSGVRAGLGYKPACVGWDADLTYTYFSTQEKLKKGPVYFNNNGATTHLGQIIVPDWVNAYYSFIPYGGVGFLSNKSEWRMNFNYLDLDVGREFYAAPDVALHPFFGLRGVSTNERMKMLQTIVGASNVYSAGVTKVGLDAKSQFHGIGPVAGLDTTLTLVEGLDIFGSLAGSILWGYSRVNVPYWQPLNNITVGNSLAASNDTTHSQQTTVFNLDLGVGFRWNEWLNCGTNLLSFTFGWEQHIFSNLNLIQNNYAFFGFSKLNYTPARYDRNVYRGYLTLSGFVFGLSYYY